MQRAAVVALALAASGVFLYAQEQRNAPQREESIPVERFTEAHAPLLAPKVDSDAGALTEKLLGGEAAAPESAFAPVERRNFIDEFIFSKIESDQVPHAPLASDAEFLRRATLDITGRIPTTQAYREFLADNDPAKRSKLIDKLLGSEEYVEKWAYFYLDLFRANGKMGRGQDLFHYWVKENLRADRPYDEFARAIMSASAKSNHVVAAANVVAREHVQGKAQPDDGVDLGMVHQLDTDDELSILYAKVFLGLNISCIGCHDGTAHLEKVNVWMSQRTREEFFRNAAFLGHTRYLMYWEHGKPQSGEFLIDDHNPGYDTDGASMLRTPRTGGSNQPAFLLTGEQPKQGEEPRDALARMLTSNPQFARATVNMFWKQLMGMGIVEPFDEFDLARQDPANVPEGWELQPSHPKLLNALADDFRSNDYSLKHLIRTICNSSAYQLSARFPAEWKESYTKYFARKYVRMLTAEELHDALVIATNRPSKFKFGDETVGMAMKLSGPAGKPEEKTFMRTFGQSTRRNPPKPLTESLLQPLALMQSPVVTGRVEAVKDSRLQNLLEAYNDNGKVVEELFLATISRVPSDAEKQIALEAMERDRVHGAEDLQWALINNVEFFFNY